MSNPSTSAKQGANHTVLRIANILSHNYLSEDIQFGMDIDEFHLILPHPDLTSHSRKPYFEVFDGVDFVFHRYKLYSINIRLQEVAAITSPRALVVTDIFDFADLNIDQWLEVLRRYGCECDMQEYNDDTGDLNISTQPHRLSLHYDRFTGRADLLTVYGTTS